MAEFRLERFKYNWKGDWTTGTAYKRDDIVRVNGKSYVCIIGHVASPIFASDLTATLPGSNPPQPQPKWTVMTSGKSFEGEWLSGTNYNLGDIVLYDSTIWLCINSHTSTAFSDNSANWEIFAQGIAFKGNWQGGRSYVPGSIVRYGGMVYKCTNTHASQNLLEDNISDWEIYHEGVEYKGNWQTSTTYKLNDLVRYGASVYRCIETHTAISASLEDDKFTVEVFGTQYEQSWSPSTYYNIGDIVRNRGFVYYAVTNNNNSEPTSDLGNADWVLLSRSINFVGNWDLSNSYKSGDVVLRGGNLYTAINDVAGTQSDGSTSEDYLDGNLWELTVPGKKFKGTWTSNVSYFVGEVVYHLGNAYTCTYEHLSANENFPGDNGNAFEYWDLLIQAGGEGGLQKTGDLLTFGPSRFIEQDGSTAYDDSTLGDTRLAIGDREQLLSVNSELEVFWRNLEEDTDTVYVATNGIDDVGRGTFQKPFKTIRYAAEYVEDNFEPLTPVIIRVSGGKFEEIAPIIIPAGCAINGDELRSTTVLASGPIDSYQNDFPYVLDYIDYLKGIILNIVSGIQITPQEGNTTEQYYLKIVDLIDPSTGLPVIDEETGQPLQTQNDFPVSDVNGATSAANLFDNFINFVEFRISDGSINPDLTGSNDQNPTISIRNAGQGLKGNIEFIASEILAYLRNSYPNITFDEFKVKNDVRSLIRGVARDLAYEGNYGTLFAGRRYANAVNGSQLDDLFYVRDTTGLRDMTTGGLRGFLNPPGVFDLYQKPTGGALVSLDPGWGPADERTWIINRSPYIQGVTNTGFGCVGMKVDGALHNGGNKSMTANDFTQVLSDGIGAWISNNGRAELVSVFTYYCQIGYFAEDGGVIRATNGNNSYGRYGSVADGQDDNEVPQNALVNNRNNEAQVSTAFAGGAEDRIFLFEYSNAGQNYTSANAVITGAGDFASVEYTDFRDESLFEARLTNGLGSSAKGGANYLARQGNAQETADASSTIKLSASDPTSFLEDIDGMRIIIIGGKGTGQYGYVVDYDFGTKDLTVRRESDGELGWDHIIPGTPIETTFDLTTRYRIEPRIDTTHPGFSNSTQDGTVNDTFVDVIYGHFTENFNNIEVATGSGNTFDDAPTPAEFNVIRAGRDYIVSIANPGAGYSEGDILTIPGSSLGGSTPKNDLQIIINSVTDDSTSSIITFSSSGTGRNERFIALNEDRFAYYSDNGYTWTLSSLPYIGDFRAITNGNNKYVALANLDNRLCISNDGVSWTTNNLPTTESFTDIAYGNDSYIIISDNTNNVLVSSDLTNWTTQNIPDDASGDSTVSQWTKITYGAGKFVAVSANDRAIAVSTNSGTTWTRYDAALPDLSPDDDWSIVSIAFGNNRFVVLDSTGRTAYSLDGETWYRGTDAPATLTYTEIKYGNGTFIAVGTDGVNPTNTIVTTEDCILWYTRTLDVTQRWGALTYGQSNAGPRWLLMANDSTNQSLAFVRTGAKAKLRASLNAGSFTEIKILDPGSGYDELSPPVITVTDPNAIAFIETSSRMANGVLAQPDYVNRGTGYRTATSTITISGDGFADIIPEANVLKLSGIQNIPSPGVQIRITDIIDPLALNETDLLVFSGATVTDLGDDGSGNGTRLVEFSISPGLETEYNLSHGTTVTLRERYSQCRISGHDFLDIGTGNFEQTNYPSIYADGNFFVAAPENEVLEQGGGRVFYTSTDQDGNFRTGELFSVQQATGVVTISAEFFDLDGLSELALGGVRLGGSGAAISEFSTDPTFSADSNNVVPTQRAIATFLADRLSVGGENVEINAVTAGRIQLGTEDDVIDNVVGGYLVIPRDVTFDGSYTDANDTRFSTNVSGTIISQMLFFKQFDEGIQ